MKNIEEMNELCETAGILITDTVMRLDGMKPGYELDPDDVEKVLAVAETAKAAGQVKGSLLAWRHTTGRTWFVFRRREDRMSCTMGSERPPWVTAPKKAVMVSIMVPEHLEKAMRLHLGELTNPKVTIEA